jgi:hypothetical protein
METLGYKSSERKRLSTWKWRYTRLVPTIALIHCVLFITFTFFALVGMGHQNKSNESLGYFFGFLAFPIWFIFDHIPTPLGMLGDGLFWGFVVVGGWHLLSIMSRRLWRYSSARDGHRPT